MNCASPRAFLETKRDGSISPSDRAARNKAGIELDAALFKITFRIAVQRQCMFGTDMRNPEDFAEASEEHRPRKLIARPQVGGA